MKLHRVDQSSPEWIRMRLGIPTASNFDKIITPAKGEFSKSSRAYAHYLLAERALNRQLDSLDHLEHIARGKDLEPQAVGLYEFMHDIDTLPGGFVTTDDGRVGCSPDRLLPDGRGCLEVKCPSAQVHMGYIVDGPGPAYRPQVQGQLLVAEREYNDLFSYHPDMPPVEIRTERDDAYIAKMETALDDFLAMFDEMFETARRAGLFRRTARVRTAADEMAEQVGA